MGVPFVSRSCISPVAGGVNDAYSSLRLDGRFYATEFLQSEFGDHHNVIFVKQSIILVAYATRAKAAFCAPCHDPQP